MEFLAFALWGTLISAFIFFFISIFIGALLLHFATKVLNFKRRSLATAFAVVIVGCIVSSIMGIIPFIGWILGLITYWYFIKIFYNIGWGKAMLAWLISIVITFLIAIVIAIIFGLFTGITFFFT